MFKPIRPSDSTAAISLIDPAIDKELTGDDNLKKYKEQRLNRPSCFRDLIKEKSGEKITVFEIGVIQPDDMARILDECGGKNDRSEEMFWRSFLCSCRNIDPWPEKLPKKNINGVEYVEAQYIKTNFIRGLREVAVEIGLQAWMWNRLSEEETKN